jgi:hypothetical protein
MSTGTATRPSTIIGEPVMAAATVSLARPRVQVDLAAGLRAAARAGKPLGGVLQEMVATMLGPGKLTAEEFFYFRLFEAGKDRTARRRYVGLKAQDAIFRRTCDERYWSLAHDKLLCQAFLQGLGHPVPEILALLCTERGFGATPRLNDQGMITRFLECGPFPMFLKPVAGMFSLGTIALERFDAARGSAIGFDGRRWTAAALFEAAAGAPGGLIAQRFLEPHPAAAALAGRRLGTLRLVVIVEATGPRLYRAVWKLPVSPNMADNFWLEGNLLAAVDRNTGAITRVIRGHGAALQEVACHPDTGQTLVGVTVPLWEAALATTLAAAADVPGIGLQAWDVGLTGRGPVLVELNVGGDVNLPQLAHNEGLMTEEFTRFMQARAARR